MFEYKKFPDPNRKGMQAWPYDPKTQRHYRKIVGGFVSPGPAEGAVLVCGLEYSWRPPAPICLIDEARSQQSEELILKAMDFRENYKYEEIYSYNDENFIRYLSTRNAAARERQTGELHLNQAPSAATDNISYHLHLLINLLSSGGKRLVLGDGSNIHAALQAVPHSEISTASARQHALVAALGYAVSALEVYCGDYGFRDGPKVKRDYDVLNYMP